jgi:hypothetical protein
MKTRIAARIFVAGRLLGEETLELETDEIESKLPEIASHHAKLVGDRPFMVELEFLDEPDPETRYFRFGSDPTGMVKPIEVTRGLYHGKT